MIPVLEEKHTACPVHGDYTAYLVTIGGEHWTQCPTCAQELIQRQAREDARQQDAELRLMRARARLAQAELPPRLAGATFRQYRAQSDYQRGIVRTLHDFASNFPDYDRGDNVVMVGSPGTGKTHLACAIIRQVVGKHDVAARYISAQDLFLRVRRSYDRRDESEADIIADLTAPDLLVIDEVGIGRGTDHEGDLLAAVLSRRYDACRSTVIASNLDVEACLALLGDRVADRLAETATILIFDWPSYRREQD